MLGIRWTSTLQSAEVKEICIIKTWKVAVTASISENKSSGFHAKKNPKQQYLKVVTFSDPSFSKKYIYVYDHAAQITHWTDHPVHEKVLILDKN